jgi:hypothetical protein
MADNAQPDIEVMPPEMGGLPKIPRASVDVAALLQNPLAWFIGGMVLGMYLTKKFDGRK